MIPMVVMVVLLLDVVSGLASNRMMTSKHKLASRQHRYPLTSLSLPYAMDSTRMGDDLPAAPMPQNMAYPLIQLSGEEAALIPQSPVTTTVTTTTNNILTNTWRKIKNAMKFDKQAIAKLGLDFGLTYNMISNINGSVTLSTAWYIASMKVRYERIKNEYK